MSDGEPATKRDELSNESKKVQRYFTFSEFNKACDRVITVQDIKFYTNSEKLIEHSEYFRQKWDREVEIKEFPAEQIALFLESIFRPEEIQITKENIEQLIEVSIGFQSTPHLMDLFRKKKVVSQFSENILLQLSTQYIFTELIDEMESLLVEWFKNRNVRTILKPKGCTFDECIIEFLDKASEFGLDKLQVLAEEKVIIAYNCTRHTADIEKLFVQLLKKYQLSELQDSIVDFVTIEFFKVGNNESILDFYLGQSVDMAQIKDTIEESLIEKFDDNPPAIHSLNSIASNISKYYLKKLKAALETHLIDNIDEDEEGTTDMTVYSLWERIETYFSIESDSKPSKKQKECAVTHLCNLAELTAKNELTNFAANFNNFLVDGFKRVERKDNAFIENALQICSPGLAEFKEIVEIHMITDFEDRKNTFSLTNYNALLDTCKLFTLEVLQTFVACHLAEEFDKTEDSRKFNKEDFIDIAAEYGLIPLKKKIEKYFIDEFENSKRDYVKYSKLATEKNLLHLKDFIEQYIIDRFESARPSEFDLGQFCKCGYQYGYQKLQERLSEFFITEFDADLDFKYVKFSFVQGMEKFKATIAKCLKKTSITDEIWKAAETHIKPLLPDQRDYIFSLLKNSVDELA